MPACRGPLRPLVMLRAKGLYGPVMQRVGPNLCVRSSFSTLPFAHVASPSGFAGEGDWLTATGYTTGDLVANAGRYFVASADHTSGATTEPGVGDDWRDNWTEVRLYNPAGEAFAQPASLPASAEEGSTTALSFNLYLQSIDSAGDSLSWTLAEDTGTAWLASDIASGSGPMAWATITLDPTGLADGEYTDNLIFTAVGATESPITIPVTFTIVPVGEFVLLESGDGLILTEDDFFVEQEIA